jgi:hypothetical protein
MTSLATRRVSIKATMTTSDLWGRIGNVRFSKKNAFPILSDFFQNLCFIAEFYRITHLRESIVY